MPNYMFRNAKLVFRIKLLIILCIALGGGFVNSYISKPPPSKKSESYRQKYEVASKKLLTESEFEKLQSEQKIYIDSLYSSDVVDKSLSHIIRVKVMLIPVLFFLYLFLGAKTGNDTFGLVGPMVIAVFILNSLFIGFIEAAFYAIAYGTANYLAFKRRVKVAR